MEKATQRKTLESAESHFKYVAEYRLVYAGEKTIWGCRKNHLKQLGNNALDSLKDGKSSHSHQQPYVKTLMIHEALSKVQRKNIIISSERSTAPLSPNKS